MSTTTHPTTGADLVQEEAVMNAPRSRVWRALTTAEELSAWFGVKLTGSTVAPGAQLTGNITHPGYEHVRFDVIIDEVVPERLFSWRWHPHTLEEGRDYSAETRTLVEFTLEDAPAGGTLVRVVESGFSALPADRRDAALVGNSGGWRGVVLRSRAVPGMRRDDRDARRRHHFHGGSVPARRKTAARGPSPTRGTPFT
jgi:uncharacterized protein YndB with AHSA1/START domain